MPPVIGTVQAGIGTPEIPNDELGVPLSISAVLTGGADACLCLAGVRVYSTGLVFEVELHQRARPKPRLDTEEERRAFADETSALLRALGGHSRDPDPSGPRVWATSARPDGGVVNVPRPQMGGGGRIENMRAAFLAVPPPEGPLTISASWTAAGLDEGSVTVPLDAIEAARARVVRLFT